MFEGHKGSGLDHRIVGVFILNIPNGPKRYVFALDSYGISEPLALFQKLGAYSVTIEFVSSSYAIMQSSLNINILQK